MRRKYKNPPVLEALVEFHVDESAPDISIGGRFFETWKEVIERRELITSQRFSVTLGDAPGKAAPPPLPTDRLWMMGPHKWAVQVGPGFLSVHMLERPYPGAEQFRPKIQDALEQFRVLSPGAMLRRVMLRYINSFVLPPPTEDDSSEWMVVGVALPDYFDDGTETVAAQAQVRLESINSKLMYVLRAGPATPAGLQVMLDLAVISSGPVEHDALDAWLDTAHDEVVKAFEGSITDAARAAFGVDDA